MLWVVVTPRAFAPTENPIGAKKIMAFKPTKPTCEPKFKLGQIVKHHMGEQDGEILEYSGMVVGVCWQPETFPDEGWVYFVDKDSVSNWFPFRDWAFEPELELLEQAKPFVADPARSFHESIALGPVSDRCRVAVGSGVG